MRGHWVSRTNILLLAWALLATVACAWLLGRTSSQPSVVANPLATTAQNVPAPVVQSQRVPEKVPEPVIAPPVAPEYPKYQSSVPVAFRGNWDEMVSDKCFGREARFYFGDRSFANFEVRWEVTKVKLYSPTEMDLTTTLKDEDGNQQDTVWEFKLVDGGRTLTGRKKGASFFKRCPLGGK
jgi:hypothetical protein